MNSLKWLAVTAGMAALAACSSGDDVNMTNVEINAVDENLALPPIDMNADMNADMNMTTDLNATDDLANTTDNTTNAY